ncbi:hypothetical protein ECEC4402_6033, partial [Escherichia coli EC4402]
MFCLPAPLRGIRQSVRQGAYPDDDRFQSLMPPSPVPAEQPSRVQAS